MSHGKSRIVALLLTGVLATPVGVTAVKDSVEVAPIARYVSSEAKLRSYPEFRASVEDGTAQYDSTFRHPFLPLGGLVLDCRDVQRVGVTLIVKFDDLHNARVGDRYPTSFSKDTIIKYVWSHSEHSKTGGRYFAKYRMHSHRRLELLSDGLTLRDVDRVDGVLTINILVNEEPLYTTSFELVGCDSVN